MENMKQKKMISNRSIKFRSTGFTLIEVLVALAVIAIALGAILSTSGSQASQATYLKQKTIAHWIAMNEITNLQIKKEWPSTGTSTGTAKMVGREWFWQRVVLKTEDKNARQVEYKVYLDEKHKKSLTRLIGFVGNNNVQ
jgi:general secretion pathway protein I